MLDRTRDFLKRHMFRTYRYLKHPRRLKNNAIMRWFALHFLDQQVWRPCQATFAGGTAVGVFVSMQLMPGQMPMAIILSALFRVNIPVAVMLAWLSNPITFAPIGWGEFQFGQWLMGILHDPTPAVLERVQNPDVAHGIRVAQKMYLGGFVGGLLCAPIGYAISWFGWTGIARLLKIPLHRRHRVPRVKKTPEADLKSPM